MCACVRAVQCCGHMCVQLFSKRIKVIKYIFYLNTTTQMSPTKAQALLRRAHKRAPYSRSPA